MTVDEPAAKFQQLCEVNDRGTMVREDRLSIILFADHFRLFAYNDRHMSAMYAAWSELFAEHGWSIPPGRSCWTTTADNCLKLDVKHKDEMIERGKIKEGFKALGVWITADNRQSLEMNIVSLGPGRLFTHSPTTCLVPRLHGDLF